MFDWTTERPTEPGFYWVRHTAPFAPSPVIVALCAKFEAPHILYIDCPYASGYEMEIEIDLRDCTAFARVPTPEQIEALRKVSNP